MFCIYCGKSLSEGETCDCKASQAAASQTDITHGAEPAAVTDKQTETRTGEQLTTGQPPVQADEQAAAQVIEQPVYIQPNGQPVYNQPMYGQPMYGQPVYSQPVYPQPAYASQPKILNTYEHNDYTKAITSVVKAPATIFFALLLTFAFAVKLIGALEFDVLLLIGMIGAWSLHSQTHTYSTRPKCSAYKVLSVVELFTIILHCISFAGVIALIIISVINGAINEPVTYLYRLFNGNAAGTSVSLTPLAIVSLYVIVGAVFGFNMFYHITLRNNLLYIRKQLAQTTVNGHFTNIPNIIMILHGILDFAVLALIIMSKSLIMSELTKELGMSYEMTLSVLSIGLNFGIPASMLFMGTARIIAGVTLCRLGCKFKKISK